MHGPGRLEVTDSDRAAPITALRTSFDRVRALPPEQQVDECEDRKREPTLVESYIYEGRDLSVVGQPCAFTCLSTNVNPQREPAT